MAAGLVNQAEIARLFGVTPKTIRAWEAAGCPVERPAKGRGSPTYYRAGAVLRWREAQVALAASGDLAAMDMEEARRRKLAAEAALVELELSKVRAEVVEVDIAAEAVASAIESVQARLRLIGATVAPVLAQAPDTASRKEIIDAAIHEALEEISGPDFLGTALD